MEVRLAKLEDSAQIAALSGGLPEGEVKQWFDGLHPIVVVEGEQGELLGYAAAYKHCERDCIIGVAQLSIHEREDLADPDVGRQALDALLEASERAGVWKMIATLPSTDSDHLGLLREFGFGAPHVARAKEQQAGQDEVVLERWFRANL